MVMKVMVMVAVTVMVIYALVSYGLSASKHTDSVSSVSETLLVRDFIKNI